MKPIIFIIVTNLLHAFIESKRDRNIAKVVDEGGRTEEEGALLHRNDLLTRGLIIALTVVEACDKNCMLWLPIVIFTISSWWLFFDIIVAVWWLKKPWYYVGETSKIDSLLKDWHLYIKFALIAISLISYFYFY